MRRRLLISYLSITCFVLLALALPLGLSFGQGQQHQLTSRVQDEAFALALRAEQPLATGATSTLGPFVHRLAARTGDGFVVVGADGTVLEAAGGASRAWAGPPLGSPTSTRRGGAAASPPAGAAPAVTSSR